MISFDEPKSLNNYELIFPLEHASKHISLILEAETKKVHNLHDWKQNKATNT
jgi:hypothetical protein